MAIEINETELMEGYKQAAAGAQKLAASIDLLLPTLISIASGEVSGRAAKDAANSALLDFEEHRGQKLNRAKYMTTKKRLDAVGEGEALHRSRHA